MSAISSPFCYRSRKCFSKFIERVGSVGQGAKVNMEIKWYICIYLKELWIYRRRKGIATEQPRRVVAVRALLAPWNSTWLVSYRSSRDKPPSVNAQTLVSLAFSLRTKNLPFIEPLFIPSILEFTYVSINPFCFPPPSNPSMFYEKLVQNKDSLKIQES